MIELGHIKVDNNHSLVEARKKARHIALKLGCTEIRATRIEAALSETIRQLLNNTPVVDVIIYVAETDGRKGICIVFDNLDATVQMGFAGSCFDEFKILKKTNGRYEAKVFFRLFPLIRNLAMPWLPNCGMKLARHQRKN